MTDLSNLPDFTDTFTTTRRAQETGQLTLDLSEVHGAGSGRPS